jgi:glycosyltransferase involved in cell wall biosynthesis
MNAQWGVSIVVVNFNYERFLAAAIDSALSQDHRLCEVIVVDDCSTDNSRAIIAQYGDRVRSVLQETNGGQIVAMNRAWPLARYPILIFLDADDVLFPNAAVTVASIWTEKTVKAQFPLETIDEAGRRLGHVSPRYPKELDTATIRAALLRTGEPPSSPGSGNAYSRSLLQSLKADGGFDVENLREHHMDAILECNAPFYGEVMTIHEPLAYRRIHQSNLYAKSVLDRPHFAMMLQSFVTKLDYLAARCLKWGVPFDLTAVRNRSPWLLECRLVMAKLAPAKDLSRAPIFEILYRGLKAYIDDKAPRTGRVVQALWFVSVALSPRPLASWLIALRFLVAQRPHWFELLFAKLTKVNTSAWRGSPSRWRQTRDPALEPLKGQHDTRAGSATYRDNLSADLHDTEYRGPLHHEAEDISVSLIIATRDRCKKLFHCLQSVKRIKFERPWELIIVDNGSIDDTAVVLREFMSTASFPVVYLIVSRLGKSAHDTSTSGAE